MKQTLAALLLSTLSAVVLAAQSGNTPPGSGDWPMYGHDLRGNKFSLLKDITSDNVTALAQAWSVRLTTPAGRRGAGAPPASAGEEGGGRGRGAGAAAAAPRAGGPGAVVDPSGVAPGGSNPEATPIAVNGVLYLPAAGNSVLAIDGASGQQVWRFTLPPGQATTARGVAYWAGAGQPRIVFTAGPRLFTLDAATGQPATSFGRGGAADIGVPWNGVPVIYKNLAILGATTGELPQGLPGDTRAFDLRTGKKVWDFHTVPLPGEVGHETWLDTGWRNRSGTNVWTWTMTLDEERGILYMPIAGPAANYWGGDRPGNNLFANSIVAVDADSGKYRWHFQTVHHDLWDSDMSNPPTLVDITQNGRKVPALAFVGKTGYVFILDRVTGKPVFGVEERPVPKGDAPGEWYAATQPFPVKPARPLSRTEFNKERDLVRADDTSPEHVAACEDLLNRSGGLFNAGPFTPFSFHADGAPPKSTIQMPGGTGGVNWGGAAADPSTGFVFVNAHDGSLVGWIEEKKPGGNYGRGTEGSLQPFDRASITGPGPYASFSAAYRTADGRTVNLPCTRPPWAQLVAVNANTGEIAWQAPLGLTEALPKEKQLTGNTGSAGPLATSGGLVFIGATTDNRFRAFDARSGKELWSAKLDAAVNANPITYRGKNGKQYVAAIATDQLIAFALP